MKNRHKLKYYYEKTNKIYEVCSIDFESPCVDVFLTDNELLHLGNRTFKWKNLIQCTGLKGVDGNLIYEGDVIVIPNEYPFYDENVLNYVGVVEYIYNSWQYVYHCVNPLKNGISEGINYLLNEDGIEENENSYFKVIGNVYQNPEFLKD